MEIAGKWLLCDDGVTRPVVEAHVLGADGQFYERFLVDSCADCTALSAELLKQLKLPAAPSPEGLGLKGISGGSPFVVLTTVIEFTCTDSGIARVRGQFATFTDPSATDFSILGRDVLNNFDVILSRRRNQVLLLAGHHQYNVT